MTALILVVDDVPANVKLLEAKLASEYYDVISARDGFEAIKKAKESKPDLILLDVMMPGMDGFETCKKLKEDVEVSHIPVVMVTALSEIADRIRGLDAGADDFLTKPIKDAPLFARVKSLIRIKVLLDELRLRDQTGLQMGVVEKAGESFTSDVSGSRILIVDDDAVQMRQLQEKLSAYYQVTGTDKSDEVVRLAAQDGFDLIIISSQLTSIDGLRLASHVKSQDATRHVPIVMLIDEHDDNTMLKSLEMGINDYLVTPVEPNELVARVRTQIRRKKYQEALKSNYQQSVSMAITDALTGLYNRHYLNTHLENMTRQAVANSKPLSLLIMDMDHFKIVNDTYGHDVGDQILQQLSGVIVKSIRSADLAARFGGEEFVVLMPETPIDAAADVSERMRKAVENNKFQVTHEIGELQKTVSIGVAQLKPGEASADFLKRADEALYAAKNGGRNQVKVS